MSAHINTQWGQYLTEQGQVRQATDFYKKAIELEPGYWAPYWKLAEVNLGAGRIDEAVRAYGAFIQSSDDQQKKSEALAWLVEIYLNDLGDPLAAQERLAEAPELQDYAGVMNVQIHVYLSQDRIPEAAELLSLIHI